MDSSIITIYVCIVLLLNNRRCARKETEETADSKTAKNSFPFLCNGQTDDHCTSEPIRDSVNIRNTAMAVSAMWVLTVTFAQPSQLGSISQK